MKAVQTRVFHLMFEPCAAVAARASHGGACGATQRNGCGAHVTELHFYARAYTIKYGCNRKPKHGVRGRPCSVYPDNISRNRWLTAGTRRQFRRYLCVYILCRTFHMQSEHYHMTTQRSRFVRGLTGARRALCVSGRAVSTGAQNKIYTQISKMQ